MFIRHRATAKQQRQRPPCQPALAARPGAAPDGKGKGRHASVTAASRGPLWSPDRTAASLAAFLRTQLQPCPRKAEGGTPNWRLNAAVLGLPLRIDGYEERSMGEEADARAFAIVEAALPGVPGTRFGAGCHPNTVAASVLAVLNAAAGFDAADAAAM